MTQLSTRTALIFYGVGGIIAYLGWYNQGWLYLGMGGLFLLFKRGSEVRRSYPLLITACFTLGIILLICVIFSNPIGAYFTEQYLLS